MKLRDYTCPILAMREARKHGYWPRHRRDGLNVWRKGEQELALKRERRPRSTVWHWVSEVPADLAVALL